jgi:hypothetical protein
MRKRLSTLIAALAATALLAGGAVGAAQAAKHGKPRPAHATKHRGAATSSADNDSVQAGNQSSPDPAGAQEGSTGESTGENSAESGAGDGPGGHEDSVGANEGHQFEGEE